MGERLDGMGEFGGFHAGDRAGVPDEGGRGGFCEFVEGESEKASSGERRWIVRETGGRETAQCTLADRTSQAEKQGWDYQVQEPKEPNIPPKSYCQSC